MSSDKVESKSQESNKVEGYSTIDVEMKLMEVGPQKYTIDMRQNGESRFFRISETSAENYRNRIVVPMSFFSPFYSKLMEILSFSSTYTCCNVSEKKFPRDRTVFAKSCSCFSTGGRRYYFDLIDAQKALNLRISYVFNGRRDSIKIAVEALPNLSDIIEEFNKKYPSLSNNDDYPASNSYRRRGNNKRIMGGGRGGPRSFQPGHSRGFSRGFRVGGGQSSSHFNGKGAGQKDASVETKRPGILKVLSEPSPAAITNNAKRYLFEVVEGSNTFLRITETINENYKSSLHIPIDIVTQVQSVILDMNKKYTALKTSSTAAKV